MLSPIQTHNDFRSTHAHCYSMLLPSSSHQPQLIPRDYSSTHFLNVGLYVMMMDGVVCWYLLAKSGGTLYKIWT